MLELWLASTVTHPCRSSLDRQNLTLERTIALATKQLFLAGHACVAPRP